MDLTGDSVTEDALVTGYTAHDAAGNAVNGANPYEKAATDAEVTAQEQLLDEIVEELAKRCVVTEPILQARTVTPTEEVQVVTPDAGYDGLSSVTVEAAQGGEGTYGWKKCVSKLPSGYTEVEYIQSSGTQYIDLGISVPHASEKMVVEFAPTDVGNDNPIVGHAAPTWSWATNVSMVLNSRILVGNTNGPYVNLNEFCRFEYTKTYCKMNDGEAIALQNMTYTDGYNNTLFYASTKYGKHKVKSYKLYNGSTLVRDLVPCKNPSNVIGMYDLVNGKFYSNAGSGVFTAGPSLATAVVGHVVSDDANAYPDGEFLDGYYYEKIA